MNFVFSVLFIASFLISIFNGKFKELTQIIFDIPTSFLQLFFTISLSIILWMGVINVAKESGLLDKFSKVLYPIIKILFNTRNKSTQNFITTNIISNLFGLGNAATPAGIKATQELEKECKDNEASDDMILFVILNICSIQIIPTTMIMLRIKYNSQDPFGFVFIVLCVSFLSTLFGIIMSKIYSKIWKGKK